MRTTAAVALLALVSAAAAQDKPAPKGEPVTGTVTLNGKPLDTGKVRFHTADPKAKPVEAEIKDGKYKTDKLPAGEYTVTFAAEVEFKTEKGGTVKKSIIPPRYADPKTSVIKLEVKPGGMTIADYQLKVK
jgi:hypothetical protein